MQVAAVVNPPRPPQFRIGVRVEPRAFTADGVRQQHFRGQARRGDAGVIKELLALKQGGLEVHEV